MQHAVAVRVVDRVADLTGIVERQTQGERAAAGQHRLERLPGHELHHDEEDVFLLLGGEDRDDVGMTEGREQARLTQQLAEVDALLVGNLQGNLLVDPGVFREVDRAEPAAADRRQHLVFANDLAAKKHRASIAATHVRRAAPAGENDRV